MKIAPEMHVFDGKVGCQDELVPLSDLHQCGVVANTQLDPVSSPGRMATQPVNEFGLGAKHDAKSPPYF
jgi:hypothetical protein